MTELKSYGFQTFCSCLVIFTLYIILSNMCINQLFHLPKVSVGSVLQM